MTDSRPCLFQRGIAAAIIQEWAAIAGLPAQNLPNDNVWSPRLILGMPMALDVGQGALEQDQAVGLGDTHPVEAVDVLVGKTARQSLLGAAEHVDHKLLEPER